MHFQERSSIKTFSKIGFTSDTQNIPKNSLLINSSFSIGNQQKCFNEQLTQQVLKKKISSIIVNIHSTLMPKTDNIEIYRELTQDEQQMLNLVKDNQLIHAILAGVLAVDSSLKHIHKEQTHAISSLMKGVTICLGNYKKMQEQIMVSSNAQISQNLVKFYDSFKLIISDLHKIPAVKLKKNELEKHNQFINKSKMNSELQNILNRQENLLFSLLAQQNNSQRIKINKISKELTQLKKEKLDLVRQYQNMDSEKKKRDIENNLTQSGSDSRATHDQLLIRATHDQLLIKDLKQEVMEKDEVILKMNDQFTIEIQKYDKIFMRLEDQNKLLKKYNDLDTAYILQQLQYEVEVLREEKRKNQNALNLIMNQMNAISWNRNQFTHNQPFNIDSNPKFQSRLDPNHQINRPKLHQMKRSRCPSVSPTNKQQNQIHRYFSPTFQGGQNNKRIVYKNSNVYQKRESQYNRDNSPRFGNVPEEKRFDNLNDRVSKMNFGKQLFGMQEVAGRRQFKDQARQIKKPQSKLGGMRISGIGEQNFQITKLKKQMRRSKYLNEDIAYM